MTLASVAPPARRPDLGRVVFVPFCLLLLVGNAGTIASGSAWRARPAPIAAVSVAAAVLTGLCYWLIVTAYFRRTSARATSRSTTAHLAAVVATLLPLAIPLTHAESRSLGELVPANLLLLAGLSWSLWSVRTLGRSFSVLAQARTVVTRGPYSLVRHPLYFGEIVASLGLVTLRPSLTGALMWLLLCGLQLFRAGQEEQVLAETFPEYAGYRQTTKRLVPALF